MDTKKEVILGVNVSNESYESLIKKALHYIEEKKQAFIVAVNPEKIMKASKDERLRVLINSATFQIPDGVGVLIASKMKGGSIKTRITGIDLMMKLVEAAAENGKSIFLYGAKEGIAEEAKEKLLQTHPNLKIAGVLHGYHKDNDYIIEEINKANPDMLFVAMGSPRQEQWIQDNMDKLNVSIFQGVGGSFDVIAGKIKRAPAFFRKLGLEWLYRLIVEPWRWKRQLALPKFLWKVLRSKK